MQIAVSILKSKFNELDTIKKINKTTADYIHLDVCDGIFVNTITNNYEYLHASLKPLRIHLMVSNPFFFISKYTLLNTYSISFPFEIKEDIKGLLTYIHSQDKKCGLSINPETKVSSIKEYLPILDEVIVMSVNPGKGGQKMIEEVLYKIDELKRLREKEKLNFEIIVDGGVNRETIAKVQNADIVVSGSFICMSDDFQKQIDELKKTQNLFKNT